MIKKIFPIALIMFCFATIQAEAASSDEQEQLEEEIFPENEVIDVEIEIEESEWEDILENPMEEEYHPASVNYNGYQLDNIGLRTKGNSSLSSVANQDSDRYSLKLSLDEYINVQDIAGLNKINLNNNFQDPSYMREYLTYDLMEEMGLPTPNISFVNVYINGELWGLYTAVEQIDESFLERNFDNNYGALYKPDGEGSDLIWQDDDIDSYSGLNLKSESSNDNIILDMMDELNNGSNYEDYLNVDEILKFFAVNTALVNLDSYQGSTAHNYYLYEKNGIFNVVPWDYNMSFGGFGMGMESSDQTDLLIDEPTQTSLEERPLLANLLENEEYKETYHEYIDEIVTGYLDEDSFQSTVQEVSNLISDEVENDPTAFYSYDEHIQSLEEDVDQVPGLTSFVNDRVENVTQQLDGTIPSYDDGEGSGGNQGGPEGAGENGNVQNGEMPEGFEDREQGGPPNMNGGNEEEINVDYTSEMINTGISLGILTLSLLFVALFRRKRI
ncbi:spore coat protein CotH [Salibacterium salarium]|uniref:CotH kinase family protein n=1 Tax=Salibacterium salarium TaxID=284579 RepID=UPI0027812FC2|nr:CotH kinase family protein [Salibacterium salarium]MDQ0298335.1 spore coat protein CotH [Salibacterium salarium]